MTVAFFSLFVTFYIEYSREIIFFSVTVHDASSLRVIDFGNAINHVHREMSLYYRDFQVQTLLYRAPEVTK